MTAQANVQNYATRSFTVLVDETKGIEDLVKAGNFYRSNNHIVSKNFPKPKNGTVTEKEVTIFHFCKDTSSKAVLAEMNKLGFRPATIWELVSLAVVQPHLYETYILGLGSSCEIFGRQFVPLLFENDDVRNLNLDFSDSGEWCRESWFAAVCK